MFKSRTPLMVLLLISGLGLLRLTLARPSQAEPALALSCVAPPDNMVGWWPGDGTADDIVASNHGTLEGGATFASGIIDDGFDLDGVDEFVGLPAKEGNLRWMCGITLQ